MSTTIENMEEFIISKIQEKLNADKGHLFDWEREILFNENSFRNTGNVYVAPEFYDFETITEEQFTVWCEHFMYHIADDFLGISTTLDVKSYLKNYERVISYLKNYNGGTNFQGCIQYVKYHLESAHTEVK
jgi:hypothetical protein